MKMERVWKIEEGSKVSVSTVGAKSAEKGNRGGKVPGQAAAAPPTVLFNQFVGVLRARMRTQNTHKLVENLWSPQATNQYGDIALTELMIICINSRSRL